MPELTAETKQLIDKTADLEMEQSTNKKQYYARVMDQLEIDGWPKTEISAVGKNLVETRLWEKYYQKKGIPRKEIKINPSHWYKTASENGYTNPEYARHKTDTQNVSKVNSVSNQKLIDILQETKAAISIIQSAIKNLKDKDGKKIDLEKMYGKKELNNFLIELKAVNQIASSSANDKPKIPPNTHHIFKHIIRTESGQLNIAKLFLTTRLKLVSSHHDFLTKKQSQKFATGTEPNQLSIFKPVDRDTAIFMCWVGAECPQCKSWRVKESTDANLSCYCVDCDHKFKAKPVPNCKSCGALLYKKELRYISENGDCPGCHADIKIPQELAFYAHN